MRLSPRPIRIAKLESAMAYSRGLRNQEIGLEVGRIGERVRRRVKATARTGGENPTSDMFKHASVSAVSRTRRFGTGAGSAAEDAVSGAIKATKEITGESTEFVRDAVIGVMEGTREVAKVGRPVVRDVVAAAIRSSSAVGDSVPDAARNAVEGAIVGAHSIGVNGGESVGGRAADGVVKALDDVEAEFESIVSPAIHGVIVGVMATGGDLFDAMRDTAESLLRSGAKSGRDIPGIARLIVDEAVRASGVYRVNSTDAMMGAAQGCVEAAYSIDTPAGDAVREAVLEVVEGPASELTPTIRESIADAVAEMCDDLRERPQAWRWMALWNAGVAIVRVNGIDAGAALAYYLLLALFPMAALTVLGLSLILDSDTVRMTITELTRYYFPGSQEFLAGSFEELFFQQRIWVGIIAIAGMLLGAQGLVMATNRGINNVFGLPPKHAVGATAITAAILVLALLLFMMSVGLTAVFQFLTTSVSRIPALGMTLNNTFVWVGRALSVILPFAFAGLVFTVVYKYIPNRSISWGDATFGGVVTVIIFEVAKYVFLIIASLATQRSLLYGSLSSVILLLVWSQTAGMIFLYGASLTKQSADLRPSRSALTLRQEEEAAQAEYEARRESDIALGRDDRAYRWKDPRRREY